MIVLIFAAIIFLFLAAGAITFLGCVLIPPTRRYALSAALWFAVWGPCVIALIMLAGMALVTEASVTNTMIRPSKLLTALGWGYVAAGAIFSAVVATAASWLHQAITLRMTFALFRLYATAVVAGIGSVFGWGLSWWMLSKEVPLTWVWSLLSMLILVTAFGTAAYKGAAKLRGDPPTKFPWVSPEEFAGSNL